MQKRLWLGQIIQIKKPRTKNSSLCNLAADYSARVLVRDKQKGKTKMLTELAFELLPAQNMDEIDQMLAEAEEQDPQLVQI